MYSYGTVSSWEEGLLTWLIFIPLFILFILQKYRLLFAFIVLALFLTIYLFYDYLIKIKCI
jgi:hypothetical protein